MSELAEPQKHARIEASLVCHLATAADVFEAVVANVSKAGATVIAPVNAAEVGETVTLMLEREEGLVTLSLAGTVVHKEEQDRRGRYGIDFEPLPPDEATQLDLLLQLLVARPGPGRRAHPRVSTHVEVKCRTEDIFRGWVSDLSKGGLAIKSTRPVPVGRAISVAFGVPGLKGLVEVSGEVMSSQPSEEGFRLGVRFNPLTALEQAQVNRCLDLLLDIALEEGQVVED